MKVRKSKHIENFYYVLGGNDYIEGELLAEFSTAGNIKLGIFIMDTHCYPEQMFEVLYVREMMLWMPLFFNGILL